MNRLLRTDGEKYLQPTGSEVERPGSGFGERLSRTGDYRPFGHAGSPKPVGPILDKGPVPKELTPAGRMKRTPYRPLRDPAPRYNAPAEPTMPDPSRGEGESPRRLAPLLEAGAAGTGSRPAGRPSAMQRRPAEGRRLAQRSGRGLDTRTSPRVRAPPKVGPAAGRGAARRGLSGAVGPAGAVSCASVGLLVGCHSEGVRCGGCLRKPASGTETPTHAVSGILAPGVA